VSSDPGLAWFKVSDPDAPAPSPPAGTDVRVLVDDAPELHALADKLEGTGAQVRRVRYLVEDETVASLAGAVDGRPLMAISRPCRLVRPRSTRVTRLHDNAAEAARNAFDIVWQNHQPHPAAVASAVATAEMVPAELLPYLPFATLNPTQTEALPHIFEHNESILVVAPTGAGKTVIGMAAALQTVVLQHGKAAWLVPQRSLTDELDQELQHWRRLGLRVERLSGDHTIDIERVRQADLWVATTEKFEAICRASTFREALAEVKTVVVDEIHVLGDSARGAVLEALLARIRDRDAVTRVIGLSATVSNADEVAQWLQARLLRPAWRPSRLTWQLPVIPSYSDFAVAEAARTRLAAAITGLVTRDGGSVLVFCGSKRNVRRTALVIAAGRGANVSGVRPDDLHRLHEACWRAGVGLHYQGWEHRQKTERAFRRRELDVLVATTTVAAGVNLPARAVVIQDTEVGFNAIDVATVQQMFGRAGRAGAGESEGWAFLLVDADQQAEWRSRLVAGHTVKSQIQHSLPEHLLSETVQRRVQSKGQAEMWWVQTLAHHQGQRSVRPLHQAVEFLVDAEMVTVTPTSSDDYALAPTELGRLTTRLMVSPPACDDLRRALHRVPVPDSPEEAEQLLVEALVTVLPKLARASVGDDGRLAVARLLADRGHVGGPGRDGTVMESTTGAQQGDLARATLLAVANSPEAFRRGAQRIGGVPYAAMYPILDEAPRYLHWLACQGLFGTIHPWCAIVAADLERRIVWRDLQPPRGAGRLLWACEQMATPAQAETAVPRLWAAARARGHRAPDWTETGRPHDCGLDPPDYAALLSERTTGHSLEIVEDRARATGPAGAVLATWSGSAFDVTPIRRGQAVSAPTERHGAVAGAALFTWRGDARGTGWLSAYAAAADVSTNPAR
jgi:helicase